MFKMVKTNILNDFIGKSVKTWIFFIVVVLAAASVINDLYFETPPLRNENDVVFIDPNRWEKAPDFTFTDIDGSIHKLSEFHGKIVLIDFWATWCPTCLVEFPNIVKYADKSEGNVVLIALSSDSGVAPIKEFLAKQKPEIQSILHKPFVHVALDENRTITRKVFLTERYPETIIVAPNQKMVRKTIGVTEWDSQEIENFSEAIKKLGD